MLAIYTSIKLQLLTINIFIKSQQQQTASGFLYFFIVKTLTHFIHINVLTTCFFIEQKSRDKQV